MTPIIKLKDDIADVINPDIANPGPFQADTDVPLPPQYEIPKFPPQIPTAIPPVILPGRPPAIIPEIPPAFLPEIPPLIPEAPDVFNEPIHVEAELPKIPSSIPEIPDVYNEPIVPSFIPDNLLLFIRLVYPKPTGDPKVDAKNLNDYYDILKQIRPDAFISKDEDDVDGVIHAPGEH